MSAYQFDRSMIETLANGLKKLDDYISKFDLTSKSNNKSAEASSIVQNLYHIHRLTQQETNLINNANFPLFRLPDHTFAKYFLCCFSLNDICKIGLVCSEFNKSIRSNIFRFYYVKIYEKTDIRIDLNAFSGVLKKIFSPKKTEKVKTRDEYKFELESQVETQKRVNNFLLSKSKENEEEIKSIRNDIELIKKLLEEEKSSKNEATIKTKMLEDELASVKENLDEKYQELSQHSTDLETKVFNNFQ